MCNLATSPRSPLSIDSHLSHLKDLSPWGISEKFLKDYKFAASFAVFV